MLDRIWMFFARIVAAIGAWASRSLGRDEGESD